MKSLQKLLTLLAFIAMGAIQVLAQPNARFSADPLEGEAPLTVQFDDRSQGEITEYFWEFGDGNTSEARKPEHTYTFAGQFTVKLTVTGPNGSDTEERENYITVTGQGSLNPPRDLTAEVAGNNVNLEWHKPVSSATTSPCDTSLLGYDDGSADTGLTTSTDNVELCVRFTPDSYPATILGSLFIGGISAPDEYGLRVYLDPDGDNNGPSGSPEFDGVVDITQAGANGGLLPEPIVVESGDFYVSLVNLSRTDGFGVGLDNNSPDAGRSWIKLGNETQRLSGTQFEGNLVINALIEQCNSNTTILAGSWAREPSVLPVNASHASSDVLSNISRAPFSRMQGDFLAVARRLFDYPIALTQTSRTVSLEGYNVYRSTSMPVVLDASNRIETISSESDTTHTDSGLEPNTYYYAVTALYDEGESGPSNEVMVDIVEVDLNPPQDLRASVSGNGVALDWQAPEGVDDGDGDIVSETEPNDGTNSSDPLNFGQTGQGAINPAGDADFWRFQGSSGQRVVIDIDAQVNGSELDAVLGLFVDHDADGDGVPDIVDANDDFGGSLDSRLDVTLPRTDRYFIFLIDFSLLDDNSPNEGGPDYFYDMSLTSSSALAAVKAPSERIEFVQESKASPLSPALVRGRLRELAMRPFVSSAHAAVQSAATLQNYSIYRDTSSPVRIMSSTRIATVSSDITQYQDDNLPPGTFYYVATAVYDDGESGPSNEAEATITQASGDIEIAVESSQVVGAEFWLDITVADVQNLFGVSFDIDFTNTDFVDVLTPTSSNIVPGDFLGDDVVFAANVDEADGKVSIGISRKSGQGGVDGSGIIANVRFASRQSTPAGTESLFSLNNIEANDPDGRVIGLSSSNAIVTFESGVIVWPGDTDNSGVVNQADVLPLGLHWGTLGPVRDNASTAWVGQPATPWSPEAATYADANGNGVISQADVLPIGLNWGESHTTTPLVSASRKLGSQKLAGTNAPVLWMNLVGDANPGEEFTIEVTADDVSDLFGISFELAFSPATLVEVQEVTQGDLLGDDIIFVENVAEGLVSVGLSRKAGQGGVGSSGVVAIIRARMSSAASIEDETLLNLQNVLANDPDGVSIEFDVLNGKVVTSVGTDFGALPSDFALYPNVPNPFNPSTRIGYDLPEQTEVKIDVFDLLGRHVQSLVDDTRPAGQHVAVWNGQTKSGRTAASGIYIYRIRAGHYIESRRMLLLK